MNTENGILNLKTKLDLRLIYEDLYSGYFSSLCKGTPFSEPGALTDLMYTCSHADYQLLSGEHPGYYKQGSTRTSLSDLAEQWGWDRNKVSKFISKLQQLNIIHVTPGRDGSVITLIDPGDNQALLSKIISIQKKSLSRTTTSFL